MIDVLLYGDLGKTYGKVHRYSVNSVPEAIRALDANFKGFRKSIREDGLYKVVVDKKIVNEEDICRVASHSIKIVPVVQGGGKGVGQAILGAVLFAVAWWNPYNIFGAGSLAAGTSTSLAAKMTSSFGISMMLGGISQMLTKTPTITAAADSPAKNPSYSFDGPVNTTAQGNPVPLAYGKILAGSQVISAGLEVR